ncbi:hypothetical protein F4802DRAFT_182504 [Xylaria palmicola]|nr:hypothetical protein F4802DRAFT_182504 [Xylaria palmicola]
MPMYGAAAPAPAPAAGPSSSVVRLEPPLTQAPPYLSIPASVSHKPSTPAYHHYTGSGSPSWPVQGKYSPVDSIDDMTNLSDHGRDRFSSTSPPLGIGRNTGKSRPQRKSSNRDEFDGPQVQFLARPPSDYIAMQEREMPQLPTNLRVSEQDSVLAAVNDRLSRCAFDFVAKYQFPIPLTPEYVAAFFFFFFFQIGKEWNSQIYRTSLSALEDPESRGEAFQRAICEKT